MVSVEKFSPRVVLHLLTIPESIPGVHSNVKTNATHEVRGAIREHPETDFEDNDLMGKEMPIKCPLREALPGTTLPTNCHPAKHKEEYGEFPADEPGEEAKIFSLST